MAIRQRTARYWDKRALARMSAAERNAEAHLKQIRKIYQEAQRQTVNDIREIYGRYYEEYDLNKFIPMINTIAPTGDVAKFYREMERLGIDKVLPDNYRGRISRLEMINAQIWGRTKQLAIKEHEVETNAHIKTINGAFGQTVYDTAHGIGVNPPFSQLNERGVERLLNTPWQGGNYSTRIWGNTDILATQLQETLTRSFITGMSPARTIREIRDRFDVGEFYAERLIRTETNHFENETEFLAYREMGITRYVFVATLDGRTSQMCQDQDGKIYEMSERAEGENYPPLHPNCRSTVRGYIGKEYEPRVRVARDPVTDRNIYVTNMPYKDWIKRYRYNPSVQPEIRPSVIPKPNEAKMELAPMIRATPKVDPALRNAYQKELDALYRDYPFVREIYDAEPTMRVDNRTRKLGSMELPQVQNHATRDGGGNGQPFTYTLKPTFTKQMEFVVKNHNNSVKQMTSEAKRLLDKKWWSSGDLTTIPRHEFGHLLDNFLTITSPRNRKEYDDIKGMLGKTITGVTFGDENYRKILQFNAMRSKFSHDFMGEFYARTGMRGADISEYSKTSRTEAFAEMFARYRSSATDKTTSIFGKMLEEAIKEIVK